jgi:Domain of unknown function (DU1801)
MAELKTKPTSASIKAYLEGIEPEDRRKDAKKVDAIMRRVTGEKGAMWGESIVGYGTYHYVYASKREGDWMLTGFASRKAALTLYIMAGFSRFDETLAKLGKHKTGKGCLYIKSLDDVDLKVLESLISQSVKYLRKKYS